VRQPTGSVAALRSDWRKRRNASFRDLPVNGLAAMFLFVLLKGQARCIVGVSSFIHHRTESVSFLLGRFATTVIGIIYRFSVAFCCLFADKAQSSLFFTRWKVSLRVHGHALTVRLGIAARQLHRDASLSRFLLQTAQWCPKVLRLSERFTPALTFLPANCS
jgi:hypothetical protein